MIMHRKNKSTYEQYLLDSYPRNPETGNLVIEILLERYVYLFNEWDNSSFKRRDMDADLISFLDDCALEIPPNYGLELAFGLTEDTRSEGHENMVITGLRNHYRRMLDVERRELGYLKRRMLLNMLIAFLLLFAASLLGENADGGALFQTLVEGFFVGGWVFAWTAIDTFAFKRRELVRKAANLERLLEAPVRFSYNRTDINP
jgi:hypothetical protein